jgi:hypothetical protein
MKNLNSNGLTIEQLEERMEFTAMGLSDLTPEQLTAVHEAGYSDADLAKGSCGGSHGYWEANEYEYIPLW